MKILRLTTFLLIIAMVLAACGSGNPGGADPDPEDPVEPAECGMTLNVGVTIPTLFENGPEDCDYFFPGHPENLVAYAFASDVLIEAGTVLQFGQNAILYVRDEGRLTAVGTADERIVFEGSVPTHGSWYGICFEDSRESRLEFVDVRWGGKVYGNSGSNCRGGIAGMWPGSSEPVHIRDTTVSGSYVNGLSVHDLILGEFANNAFFGNLEYGVAIDAVQVRRLDAGSDYSGIRAGAPNTEPFVYASGGIEDPGEIHVWSALDVPYFVSAEGRYNYSGDITVFGDTTLVLDEGTNIVFDGDSELYVYGGASIGMAGTPTNPVVLTGLAEMPGSWKGVTISSSAADLRNVQILWAGRSDLYQGSLAFVEVGSDPNGKALTNVFIDGSEGCAVTVWHDDLSLFDPFDVDYGENNEEGLCFSP